MIVLVEMALGRQRVLPYFLDTDRLFKTDLFFDRFEAPARRNIAAELRSLSGDES